jgi:hypothetical protein
MSDAESAQLAEWFSQLLATHDERTEAIESAYLQLEALEKLSKVTVHKYQCAAPQACLIARVIRIGGTVLCAVRDYKFSPGVNEAESVPEARRKNTLNGDNHWPGHVHDVIELDKWGDSAGMHMVCRHFRGVVYAKDVLTAIDGVVPGHPNKPTRLGENS